MVTLNEVFLFGNLIFTLFYPKYSVTPLPRKKTWQYWFTRISTLVSTVGIIVLSVLDWNSSFFTHWSRFVIGSILVAVGTFFAIWTVRTIIIHTSSEPQSVIITKGPYKHSRNPQYVGDILTLTGIIIISNSSLAFITGILGIILLTVAPFTEEPWLRRQFKEEYDEYCKKTPRFL
jgi:protein-S-isoprenylcysteine O-methyltransferase Ste14